MQVDETENGFVIVRGKDRDVFFCFFVDSDSSCWSKLGGSARFYSDRSKAENDLHELRKRAMEKRRKRGSMKHCQYCDTQQDCSKANTCLANIQDLKGAKVSGIQ